MRKSAESDQSKGLADASADLMQSLDNLLDSLESPEPDRPIPATDIVVESAQPEAKAASLGGPAQLSHDGRIHTGAFEQQQQYAPRSPGYIGEPSFTQGSALHACLAIVRPCCML